MGLRLEQRTVNEFKRALAGFLPHYIDYDYEWPTELHYTFSMLYDTMVWTVDFTKINFEQADLDINESTVELVNPFDTPMIKVVFPAIKYMRMNALMDTNSWWIPDQSKVSVELNKFEIDFNMDIFATP